MKHKRATRTLGRTATKRRTLWRTLASDVLKHGTIVTTEAKAKELRRHLEPLITKAKGDLSLSTRRQLLPTLRAKGDLAQLQNVAKVHKDRPGGYLRLTRLPITRHDQATEMRVDIIDFDKVK